VPLTGELVSLRELRSEDYPLLASLRNDLDTQGWGRTLPPDYTIGMYEQRFDSRPYEYRRTWAIFVIELRSTGEAVGFCNYTDLEDRHSATIGISVSKEHWGRGVATEANELLLRFLFHELGLQVVRLWTQNRHPRTILSAEKHGFSVAARFRQSSFLGGEVCDTVVMDLLREEWYAAHPELKDSLES